MGGTKETGAKYGWLWDFDPLPMLLHRIKKYEPWTCGVSGTCKTWKSTSRRQTHHCSSWLVLPHHHNNITTEKLQVVWERYWWRFHKYPCTGRWCCPDGVQFCQKQKLDLTKVEQNLEDPNSCRAPHTLQITNAIMFKGKLYVLSLQGTLAGIDIDSQPMLTMLDVERVIPSTPCKGFREYLVASRDLLVVFLMCKKSMSIVDDIEVYKLDLPRLTWKRVKSLGNHTLFLSYQRCVDIYPIELAKRRYNKKYYLNPIHGYKGDEWWSIYGYRRNCIYFTHRNTNDWWEFHMKDKNILFHSEGVPTK